MTRILLCAVCCATLAAGCGSTPTEEPTLDTEDPPDTNVQPPSWYKPAKEHDAWPLGPEPKHGTSEWREWCRMRYNSRGVVRPAAIPPEIDGTLDDAAWKGAQLGTPFVDVTNEPADPATAVFLAYDENNLYIAARVDEPLPAKIRANAKQNDLTVNRDDHIAIHLVPQAPAGARTRYSMLVNSKGFFAAALRGGAEARAAVKTAAGAAEGAWTIEAAIPLNALGAAGADPWGQVWQFSIIRQRYAGDAGEVSSWTRIVELAKGRISWGHVIFKGVRPKEPEKEPPKEKPKEKEGSVEPPADTKAGEAEPKEKPKEPEPTDAPKEGAPEAPADTKAGETDPKEKPKEPEASEKNGS